MTTTLETLAKLDDAGRRIVFTEARSANSWADVPVSDEQLITIRDLAKFGPTTANSNPGRILFVRPGAGRERLVEHMAEGNRAKTLSAPATAVIAYDPSFHQLMPTLFPGRGEAMRDGFFASEDTRHAIGRLNGALLLGYFISAVRAEGLAAGPMGGFDAAGIDAEFFGDSGWKSLVVVNIGHPGADAWFPRLPRPSVDEAVAWA